MASAQESPMGHILFTLANALEWYEAGWCSWDQLQEEVRQAYEYYHWIFPANEGAAQNG